MNRKLFFAILFLIAIGASIFFAMSKKNIVIVSIVKIDPITLLENGFKNRIASSFYGKLGVYKISYNNALGDPALQNQIVDKIILEKPDLIYVLGTPLAQAIQKRDPSLIIVQGTVTDPIAAGLANSWERPGKNYAAITDLPPISLQLQLIQDIVPNIQSLGIIYNTGEVNSVAVVNRIRKYIADNKLKIKLEERPISTTADISTVVQSLKNNVQAIYIPPDNTVHAGIKVVCKIANDNKIPVFATVESSINDGALVALSLDFYKLGEQSADIALMILEGKQKAGDIAIVPNDNPNIYINDSLSKVFNIDLSSVNKYKNVKVK